MTNETEQPPNPEIVLERRTDPPRRSILVPIVIALGVAAVIAGGVVMFLRSRANTNHAALDEEPKGVTVAEATSASFRSTRKYVATLDAWVQASVGPQLVSAFVDTVLVRPGGLVKRGQVLATLDCRNTSTASQAVAMHARALEARQKALASEAARLTTLLDGGFVSANEAEQKLSMSNSQQAEILATQAKLAGTALEVNDCILRAPFDGEVSRRAIDPGAFVRPGTAIVTLVDRSTIRISADVPEVDFAVVPTGAPVRIRLLATGEELKGLIARRSPAANAGTRTVHFEVDIPDPERKIPVGTTAELLIDVGEAEATTQIPLTAASVRGTKATVFVIDGDKAKKVSVVVKGETAGVLFVDKATIPAGSMVVTEGRSLLQDGDKVIAKLAGAPSTGSAASVPPSSADAGKGTKL